MRNGNPVITGMPVMIFSQVSCQKPSEPKFNGGMGKQSPTTREKIWDHPGDRRRRRSKFYGYYHQRGQKMHDRGE